MLCKELLDVSGNFKVRGASSTTATWTGSTLGSQMGSTFTSDAGDRIFSIMGMSSDGLKIVGAAQLDRTSDSRGTIQAHYYNGSSWEDYGSLIEAQGKRSWCISVFKYCRYD